MLRRTGIASALLVTLSLLSCANTSQKPAQEPPDPDLSEDALPEDLAEGKTPEEDVVQKAARPFTGYRALDRLTLTDEELITYLASADGICIGEQHGTALDHYGELRLVSGLLDRRYMRGFELGVALEMVRSQAQAALNRFSADESTLDEFAELAQFREEWGVPLQYYAPQLEAARDGNAPLIGLGVPRALTRKVSEVGLVGLTPKEARFVPELDRSLTEHRALFDALMQDHPGPKSNSDHYYEAQLIWDEQMAETSADWLSQRFPGRKVLVLAGVAHCHRSGIPARFERRTGQTMVSVLPVSGGKPTPLAQSPANAEERIIQGYDFQMVFD